MNILLGINWVNVLIGIFMILPFVYEFCHGFRLYLKFFIFYATILICSLLCIPFIIWRPGNVRNTLIATFPLRFLSPLLGLHWEVRGLEHITPDRPAIVVVNHQSSIDFLGMVHVWPMFEKISAIAKKELFYAMPFGLTAWLCGTRFIDRSNPEKAKASMNAALDYVKKHSVKLWVFPEGTRNMTDEMLEFKKGAFHLAIAGQLPVLPLIISSYQGFLSHPLKVFNPGNIVVTCLPPVPTEGMTMEDMPKLMKDIRDQMMECFTKVNAQMIHPYPLVELPKRLDSTSYHQPDKERKTDRLTTTSRDKDSTPCLVESKKDS